MDNYSQTARGRVGRGDCHFSTGTCLSFFFVLLTVYHLGCVSVCLFAIICICACVCPVFFPIHSTIILHGTDESLNLDITSKWFVIVALTKKELLFPHIVFIMILNSKLFIEVIRTSWLNHEVSFTVLG